MSSHWTCPHGHQTDLSSGGDTPACPQCGATLTESPVNGQAAGTVSHDEPSDRTINSPALEPTIEPPAPPDARSEPWQTIAAPSKSIATPSSSNAPSHAAIAIEVPGYEILGELGRGGMGVVYKARQVGLNRLVALKMILAAEHAGPDQRARFQVEAEAVASLQHPHIVQIYEVGEVDGRPFFSLEYVDGGSLAQKVQGQPQPPRPAAALLATLARAVAAAHEKGIVHRDLKPANVLLANPVSTSDSARSINPSSFSALHTYGVPKITDFGLAKRLEGGSGQTQSGSIMGTPSYMAPEQAAGQVKLIGPPTDVYALGAILYELLTGRPPFRADSPLETIMQVIRDEPVPPGQLNPKVPRDLAIICLKCLEKSTARRYRTANDLADDLARFLEGEPISARPATRPERVRKWVRRHPAAAALAGVGALTIAALMTGGLMYQRDLRAALALAQLETDKLNQEKALALQRTIRLTVANGTGHLSQGDLLLSLPWFAEALRLEGGDREKEEMHRVRLAAVLRRCPRLVQAWFHEGRVTDAAFSPDGKHVATACDDGLVRLFVVGELSADRPGKTLTHPAAVRLIDFSPDGCQVATACADNKVRVWDVSSGKPVGAPMAHAGPVTAVAFDPEDASRVLSASRDHTARLWDAGTGQPTAVVIKHAGPVLYAEFSPDGLRVVTASEDGTARVWDAKTGRPASPVFTHAGPVVRARFSPDGQKVLTASRDQTASVWDVSTGRGATDVIRRSTPLTDAAYSPNGRDVAAGSTDGTVRVWDVATNEWRPWVVRHESPVLGVGFSPDGRALVTCGEDNTARVWELTRGDPVTPPLPHNGSVYRATFSADGGLVLTASQDGLVRLWDVASARAHAGEARSAASGPRALTAYSPDRRLVLRPAGPNEVQVCDAGTGAAVAPALRHGGPILHADFSPDGRRVLTASADRTARVWDARTGEPVGPPLRHGSEVFFAVFSPHGRRVATTSADNTARLWDVGTSEPVTPPLRHNGNVERAAFSADGRCLMTATEDGIARVWDTATGETLTPALHPAGWVKQALASGTSAAGWDLPPDQRDSRLLLLLSHWLAAARIDDGGHMLPLDVDELRATWDELRTRFPTEFALSAADRVKFDRREAHASETARDWFAAAVHLSRLIELTESGQAAGEDGSRLAELHARRGNARAEQGRWSEAAADYRHAVELGDAEESALASHALAELAAGNVEAYRRASMRLLEECGESVHGETACRLAWVCLLAPGPGGSDDLLTRLAGHTASAEADESMCRIVRGALLARRGEWEAAINVLAEGQVLARPVDAARAWLFLALAEQNLGRTRDARRWLAQADRWIDAHCRRRPSATGGAAPVPWQQRVELQALRTRVQKVLEAPDAPGRMEKIAD